MIKSFRNQDTGKVFQRRFVKRFSQDAQIAAYRKLVILDAAETLSDLRIPPGNRLEKLSGNRYGEHSIRVNERSRICFKWNKGDAYEVEIVDYH